MDTFQNTYRAYLSTSLIFIYIRIRDKKFFFSP